MDWTKRRTFTREQVAGSRAAWEAGGFSDEWNPWRRLAAVEAGIIYPPSGDAYDSWADANPSQRAILIRAIRETPTLLRRCITEPGARSWGDVVDRLLRGLGEMGEDVRQRELDADHEPSDPSPREAAAAIAAILGVIRDSVP